MNFTGLEMLSDETLNDLLPVLAAGIPVCRGHAAASANADEAEQWPARNERVDLLMDEIRDTLRFRRAHKQYEVFWVFTVDQDVTDDAHSAARRCHSLYFKDDHGACVFSVLDRSNGNWVDVDLAPSE